MADTDQSLNNLRYNQVSGALEGFGGGSPQWTSLTLTNVDPTQVPVTRLINTTAPLVGGGNLSADRTLSIPVATSLANGYLSSSDWTTFNAKQPAGNYITDLTGDATATGPGSTALTLATVNGNVGSFTNSSITVNEKGLITAASNGTAVSPVGNEGTVQLSDGLGGLTVSTDKFAYHADNGGGQTVLVLEQNGTTTPMYRLHGDNKFFAAYAADGTTLHGYVNFDGTNAFLHLSPGGEELQLAPGLATINTALQLGGAVDVGGFQVHNVIDPTSAQDAATKNYVDTTTLSSAIQPILSGASAGGAATEELTVTGLLTTSIIYAVTPVSGGANNVAMTGYVNDTNGSLNVSWTADPGVGAQVLVLFHP